MLGRMHFCFVLLALYTTGFETVPISEIEMTYRECEPIRIEMCKNLGYNDTSMPNLAGNEIQSDAEYTLQSFSPLIEYVCSSQLKLFLCATYVPMCTPKAPIPIGPCRSLCESVRSRCDPVLKGFGYNWPPALDCILFPKENNQETMCMEGPGETQEIPLAVEKYLPFDNEPALHNIITSSTKVKCPEHSSNYMKLYRTWRCASLCEAINLFGPKEKRFADIVVNTCTCAALGLALVAIFYLLKPHPKMYKNSETINSIILSPIIWCHTMVVIGWTVRFVTGRVEPCANDPQMPNSSLMLVDGLSNGPCTATFILRYYFGMAASAWWAILCLGWHREVRRNSPDMCGQLLMGGGSCIKANTPDHQIKKSRVAAFKFSNSVTSSNLARFLAWGLPAFQTASVIVARLVDADDLLGACFVGNQSDKALQILVATPLFCYWIFGSMNLASGYLVHRRNQEILSTSNSPSLRIMQKISSISGSFLFIYCLPCTVFLMAIIYEFANIDIWINTSMTKYGTTGNETPMWPFLTRSLLELILPIICSVRILGSQISYLYKRILSRSTRKSHSRKNQPPQHILSVSPSEVSSCCAMNKATTFTTYQSVRQPKKVLPTNIKNQPINAIALKKTTNNFTDSNKTTKTYSPKKVIMGVKTFQHNGDETIL